MKRFFVGSTAIAALLLAACGSNNGTATNPSTGAANPIPVPPAAALTGAGATFPAPFYDAARFAYNQKFSQVTVNYQAVGSGAGIQQLTKKTVDFGASDVPMNATELTNAGGAGSVVEIASTLGTEGLAYNLQGVANGQLKLTPDTIAGIFLRHITNWNDPALAADNSGVSLPNQPITVVHRSDGSGTTYIFSDYMSTVNAEWKTKIGKGKSLSWPAGEQGASGNAAVATTIKNTPGAIGYVELAYILQTNMTQASLKNHDGQFVIPSAEGATAAATQFPDVTPGQFSIVDAPGKASAPITGYSWLMLYKDQADKTKGTALVDFLYWLVKDGQQYAVTVHYAKLPANMVSNDVTSLKTVTSGGSTLLTVSGS
ncbi:MAG TPA: phosphate ABC transporter substrate-binding protein PstS [Candidatus Dormibacteraeota bacterium]|jgi:phosphate transport system substrate-binding protein|nr:phosphate ABC transporter substrate-binding protein PstS [Candidatus Dormibacteraeota bacterium]